MPRKVPASRRKTRATKKSRPAKSRSKAPTSAKARLNEAQKLVAKALKVGDCQQEVILAGEALRLSQDCADAYMILAQHSFLAIDAMPFFEQAREASRRQLGSTFFKKEAGKFWKSKTARPFLQASGGFAECLWTVGRREQAVEIWREMLKLDRGDHQGMRRELQRSLLEMNRGGEAMEVLADYPEPEVWWDYYRVLANFQQEGDSPTTQALLKEARKSNRHVIPYLLKDKAPKEPKDSEPKRGSPQEATAYAAHAWGAWWQTPGAITWLRKSSAQKPGKAIPIPPVVGPTSDSKQQICELPQKYGTIYQAVVHRIPAWTTSGNQYVRPWVIVVIDSNERMIVAQEVLTERPSTSAVWDRIVQGLREPFAGKPLRPSEIQVYEDQVWGELRPHFEEIGIDIIYRKPVDEIDAILKQLLPAFSGGLTEKGLLEAPGVTPQLAGAFYSAAAQFFHSAPWQYCSEERPLEIRISDEPDRVRYAIVKGQGGDAYGLVLVDDVNSVFDEMDETGSPDSVSVTVQFGEAYELTAVDFDTLEQQGWPVATPEAYPSILRADPELMYCPPTASDLKWLDLCMHAIPEFARRHFHERVAAERFTISAAGVEGDSGNKKRRKTPAADAKEVWISWLDDSVAGHHDHDHDHDGCVDDSCSHHDHDHCH